MTSKNLQKNKGIAILFAVTLSGIVLTIALGVINIALKEVKFGTSAKSTNEAFFAADTGVECALVNDKSSSEAFTQGGEPFVYCLGQEIIPTGSYPVWNFVITGLGYSGNSCAKVTVSKNPPETTVTSTGYNTGDANCNSLSSNRVEREIEVSYTSATTTPATNLALGATATQSSDLDVSTPASKAVDGSTDGQYWWTIAITNQNNEAWWHVDLGSVKTIQSVILWNRTDCCGTRLDNAHVFVSDVPFTSTGLVATQGQSGVSDYSIGTATVTNTVNVNRTGRYIRVQLPVAEYLQLAEVQVMGY